MFSVRRRRPLPVYGPPETLDRLRRSFDYIFDESARPYEGTSKPTLELHEVEPGRPVSMAGVEALPLAFRHGHLRVFGYRFGRLAYLTDVKAIPDAERELLQGLEVLVRERALVAPASHPPQHRGSGGDRAGAGGAAHLSDSPHA